jgi:xylan 1,4-beta-xylosidase
MAARMKGMRVATSSSGRVALDDIIAGGVRGRTDLDALATTQGRQAAVMLWNYHDAEKPTPPLAASLIVRGLPKGVARVRLSHYRIDDSHSNAYTAWKAMGSPQNPTPAQFAELKSKDGLQLLEAPHSLTVADGAVTIGTEMPHHSISLLQLDW